jgi:hypothetical protein
MEHQGVHTNKSGQRPTRVTTASIAAFTPEASDHEIFESSLHTTSVSSAMDFSGWNQNPNLDLYGEILSWNVESLPNHWSHILPF